MSIGSAMMIVSLSDALSSANFGVAAAALAAYAVLVVILVAAFCYIFEWTERKVSAKMQARRGPTFVGKYGLLQNLADSVKLLSKEHSVPRRAGKALFLVTLPLMLAAAIFLIMLIPFSPTLVASDMGLGALAVFVVLSLAPLAVFVVGASSGNKFAGMGAERSVVAMLGYEVPLMIVVASVAMLADSYGFAGIIGAQANAWFVLLMPIGFVVFFVAMLAALERPPFDVRDAESELGGGWLAEFSAPYLSLAKFLGYAEVFLGSLVMAILFFGGWSGPVLPPAAWLLLKGFLIALVFVVVRAAAPRMRTDRLLRLGWTVLLPLAILNLIITSVIFIG